MYEIICFVLIIMGDKLIYYGASFSFIYPKFIYAGYTQEVKNYLWRSY